MYENSDLPLCEFIDTSWWEIMAEVLEKDVPPTEEQINRVRDLGVILDGVEKYSSPDEVDEEEWESDAESS
jgi:hypothetical protein